MLHVQERQRHRPAKPCTPGWPGLDVCRKDMAGHVRTMRERRCRSTYRCWSHASRQEQKDILGNAAPASTLLALSAALSHAQADYTAATSRPAKDRGSGQGAPKAIAAASGQISVARSDRPRASDTGSQTFSACVGGQNAESRLEPDHWASPATSNRSTWRRCSLYCAGVRAS